MVFYALPMFKHKITVLLYKFLVLFFYYIGDIACRINLQVAVDLYQKSMKMSVNYDEKIGWWLWKTPLNTKKDL